MDIWPCHLVEYTLYCAIYSCALFLGYCFNLGYCHRVPISPRGMNGRNCQLSPWISEYLPCKSLGQYATNFWRHCAVSVHAPRLFSYYSGCSVITPWPNRLWQLISDGIHSSISYQLYKRRHLRSNFNLNLFSRLLCAQSSSIFIRLRIPCELHRKKSWPFLHSRWCFGR